MIARKRGRIKSFRLFRRRLNKKGIPTAMAVQRMGTSTRRIGSLVELQLRVLMAALGMSHRRAKLANPAVFETIPRILRIR